MKSKAYSWVPSLYLGEALPFSAVMLISVIMFKELGLTDGQITVYTGWLGLPWVIKPIWSPIIDNLKTKRWWIVSMQFFMGVALALVAFTFRWLLHHRTARQRAGTLCGSAQHLLSHWHGDRAGRTRPFGWFLARKDERDGRLRFFTFHFSLFTPIDLRILDGRFPHPRHPHVPLGFVSCFHPSQGGNRAQSFRLSGEVA